MLTYQFQIIGPAADLPVSVAVTGRATGSSNNTDPFAGFAMKALWNLDDVSLGMQPTFSEGIESGALQGSFSQSFSHTVELTLSANHIYRVTLTADAFAGASSGPSAFASAFIDPVFSFAAGVGPEYSFQFSEGIGNAPVPEPSALVLLSGGLVALRLRLRRRRTMTPRTEWRIYISAVLRSGVRRPATAALRPACAHAVRSQTLPAAGERESVSCA